MMEIKHPGRFRLLQRNQRLEQGLELFFSRNRSECGGEHTEEMDVKERFVNFLLISIREKESDLECPVCLETAGGEIFSCILQHLVCSQCRPRVVECPQCRQPYPPTPLRHRYAEKIAGELETLQQELSYL